MEHTPRIKSRKMTAPSLHRTIAPLLLCVFLLIPFAVSAQTACTTDIEKSGEPDICLSVPFGGTTVVHAIGDYIVQFYKFFVGIVVTLAIFMIVVNGVRWLFARGNSASIGAAKKGIGSAITAVALVFVSVAMLRIINPDLLILDLPDLALVKRNMFFGEQRCFELPPGTKVVFEGSEIEIDGNPDFKYRPFECGQRYSIVDSKSQCMGTGCENAQGEIGLCVPPGNCLYGSTIIGSIKWGGNFYVDYMWLMAVCPDNRLVRTIIEFNNTERKDWYTMPIDQSALIGQLSTGGNLTSRIDKYCGVNDPKGYLLSVEVNDATGPIILPTKDDPFVLAKDCRTPLRDASNGSMFAGRGDVIDSATALFTVDELRAPVECNIDIQPSVFYNVPSNARPLLSVAYKDQQWNSASDSLKLLLIDLNAKYPITITSVSDDHIYATPPTCQPWLPPPQGGCQHTFMRDPMSGTLSISAHYGGATFQPSGKRPRSAVEANAGGFSCAADVKPLSGNNFAALETALSGLQFSFKQCEGPGSSNGVPCTDPAVNHLHVSVSGCGSD